MTLSAIWWVKRPVGELLGAVRSVISPGYGGQCIVLLVFVLAMPSANSAQWERETGLSLGAIHTDNARLNEDGASESAGVVTPYISVRGIGARANLDIRTAIEFNTYGGEADNVNPQLSSTADVEILEDFFFVDLNASAQQTSIDPFSASGYTNLNQSGNSTTTYNYRVNPYITGRLKNYLNYRVDGYYDEQINDEREIDDSGRTGGSFNIASGSFLGRLTLGVNGTYSKTNFRDREGNISAIEDSDNEFATASFRVGYRLSRKLEVFASQGREWNDFIDSGTTDDIDGSTWRAGAVWTPNPRATIDVSYGEQFFGSSPAASIDYRHKKSSFRLSWSKSVTDSRSLRASSGNFLFRDGFFSPNTSLARRSNPTSRENSTFINEQWEASYGLTGKRTSVSVHARRSLQERLDNGIEDEFVDYGMSLNRSFSPKLSLNLSYSRDEREQGLTNETSETDYFNVSLTRRLGPNTSVSLNYGYSDRQSDRVNDDYDQNRISVFLSIGF